MCTPPLFSFLETGGSEDVALYVGLIAVAVCLVLLLLVVTLVYCRKKEGLDSDVADSSILTAGFQPVGIKPTKAGEYPSALGTFSKCYMVDTNPFGLRNVPLGVPLGQAVILEPHSNLL